MQVNVTKAKAELSALLTLIENGEEIVIARGSKPIAKLVPYKPEPKKRVFGALEGKIWMSDDFDEFDKEIEAMFLGK